MARVLLRRESAGLGRDVRQELEDIAQEVFAALFADGARLLKMWSPERGLSLANFVGLLAEREAISILRSGRRSPWTEDPTLDTELAEVGGALTASGVGVVSMVTMLASIAHVRCSAPLVARRNRPRADEAGPVVRSPPSWRSCASPMPSVAPVTTRAPAASGSAWSRPWAPCTPATPPW